MSAAEKIVRKISIFYFSIKMLGEKEKQKQEVKARE